MANNLDLSATLALVDEISAPLRSVQSQLDRSTNKFNETKKALRELQRQQGNITSFKNLTNELNETSNKIGTARSNLAQLQQQLNATENPTKKLVNQFNKAQQALGKLEHKYDSQSGKLTKVRSKLHLAGISTTDLANHQRKLTQQVGLATQALDKQGDKLGRLKKAQAQSQKMEQMRNQSAILAAKGGAATYAAAQFLQPGMELEQAMSKVQGITRLDANSEQFKALKAQALQLGSSTTFTSADAARGQAFLAMAGFTPEAIQQALPSVLDLALAGDMDLPQVADIASNIMSGMNLDPSQMTNVADVLSAAFTRANLDISMLGETMKYAAPGAEGLNISLEELAAMAGKLGDAGIQASEGGTALRSITSRLAKPAKLGQKALDKLGITAIDASGNLRPMADILTELNDRTSKMGNAERIGIFKDIAGQEASNALKVLVEQAGSGELQKLTSTLQSSDGELKKMSATMNNNTLGDFKALTSALDGMRTSVFESNRENIRAFIQALTEMTQKFTTFANEHPQLIAILSQVFAMLAIVAVVLGTVGAAMLTVLAPMAMLRASLVTLGLPKTLTPLNMLAKSFGFIGTAIRAVGMSLMANPILALCLALAILAFTIYKNWDTLGPMFARLWQSLISGVSQFIEWSVNAWNGLVQRVINFANQLWSSLGIRFNSGIQALVGIILAFSPVGLFIRVFAAVWSYFAGLGAKFRQYGSNMLDGLKNGILGKAQSVINAITGIASKVKGAFTSMMRIHSPSRVFAGYGDNIMQGLNNGLLANTSPIKSMIATSDNLRNAMDTSQIRFDNRKPITATMAMGQGYGMPSMAQPQPITINIYAQPNHDEQTIARMVASEVAKHQGNSNALYDLAEEW